MMTDKKMIWIGIVVGSTLGGLIPSLWLGVSTQPPVPITLPKSA